MSDRKEPNYNRDQYSNSQYSSSTEKMTPVYKQFNDEDIKNGKLHDLVVQAETLYQFIQDRRRNQQDEDTMHHNWQARRLAGNRVGSDNEVFIQQRRQFNSINTERGQLTDQEPVRNILIQTIQQNISVGHLQQNNYQHQRSQQIRDQAQFYQYPSQHQNIYTQQNKEDRPNLQFVSPINNNRREIHDQSPNRQFNTQQQQQEDDTKKYPINQQITFQNNGGQQQQKRERDYKKDNAKTQKKQRKQQYKSGTQPQVVNHFFQVQQRPFLTEQYNPTQRKSENSDSGSRWDMPGNDQNKKNKKMITLEDFTNDSCWYQQGQVQNLRKRQQQKEFWKRHHQKMIKQIKQIELERQKLRLQGLMRKQQMLESEGKKLIDEYQNIRNPYNMFKQQNQHSPNEYTRTTRTFEVQNLDLHYNNYQEQERSPFNQQIISPNNQSQQQLQLQNSDYQYMSQQQKINELRELYISLDILEEAWLGDKIGFEDYQKIKKYLRQRKQYLDNIKVYQPNENGMRGMQQDYKEDKSQRKITEYMFKREPNQQQLKEEQIIRSRLLKEFNEAIRNKKRGDEQNKAPYKIVVRQSPQKPKHDGDKFFKNNDIYGIEEGHLLMNRENNGQNYQFQNQQPINNQTSQQFDISGPSSSEKKMMQRHQQQHPNHNSNQQQQQNSNNMNSYNNPPQQQKMQIQNQKTNRISQIPRNNRNIPIITKKQLMQIFLPNIKYTEQDEDEDPFRQKFVMTKQSANQTLQKATQLFQIIKQSFSKQYQCQKQKRDSTETRDQTNMIGISYDKKDKVLQQLDYQDKLNNVTGNNNNNHSNSNSNRSVEGSEKSQMNNKLQQIDSNIQQRNKLTHHSSMPIVIKQKYEQFFDGHVKQLKPPIVSNYQSINYSLSQTQNVNVQQRQSQRQQQNYLQQDLNQHRGQQQQQQQNIDLNQNSLLAHQSTNDFTFQDTLRTNFAHRGRDSQQSIINTKNNLNNLLSDNSAATVLQYDQQYHVQFSNSINVNTMTNIINNTRNVVIQNITSTHSQSKKSKQQSSLKNNIKNIIQTQYKKVQKQEKQVCQVRFFISFDGHTIYTEECFKDPQSEENHLYKVGDNRTKYQQLNNNQRQKQQQQQQPSRMTEKKQIFTPYNSQFQHSIPSPSNYIHVEIDNNHSKQQQLQHRQKLQTQVNNPLEQVQSIYYRNTYDLSLILNYINLQKDISDKGPQGVIDMLINDINQNNDGNKQKQERNGDFQSQLANIVWRQDKPIRKSRIYDLQPHNIQQQQIDMSNVESFVHGPHPVFIQNREFIAQQHQKQEKETKQRKKQSDSKKGKERPTKKNQKEVVNFDNFIKEQSANQSATKKQKEIIVAKQPTGSLYHFELIQQRDKQKLVQVRRSGRIFSKSKAKFNDSVVNQDENQDNQSNANQSNININRKQPSGSKKRQTSQIKTNKKSMTKTEQTQKRNQDITLDWLKQHLSELNQIVVQNVYMEDEYKAMTEKDAEISKFLYSLENRGVDVKVKLEETKKEKQQKKEQQLKKQYVRENELMKPSKTKQTSSRAESKRSQQSKTSKPSKSLKKRKPYITKKQLAKRSNIKIQRTIQLSVKKPNPQKQSQSVIQQVDNNYDNPHSQLQQLKIEHDTQVENNLNLPNDNSNRQWTYEEKVRFFNENKKRYRVPNEFPLTVKEVIDPDILDLGVYALVRLGRLSEFELGTQYAITPICQIRYARIKDVKEAVQQSKKLVPQQYADNIALVALNSMLVNLIQKAKVLKESKSKTNRNQKNNNQNKSQQQKKVNRNKDKKDDDIQI